MVVGLLLDPISDEIYEHIIVHFRIGRHNKLHRKEQVRRKSEEKFEAAGKIENNQKDVMGADLPVPLVPVLASTPKKSSQPVPDVFLRAQLVSLPEPELKRADLPEPVLTSTPEKKRPSNPEKSAPEDMPPLPDASTVKRAELHRALELGSVSYSDTTCDTTCCSNATNLFGGSRDLFELKPQRSQRECFKHCLRKDTMQRTPAMPVQPATGQRQRLSTSTLSGNGCPSCCQHYGSAVQPILLV